MKKPVIGITCGNSPQSDWGSSGFNLDKDGQLRLYSEAVAQAGGLPVLLPAVRTLLQHVPAEKEDKGPAHLYQNAQNYLTTLDGLILAGGSDWGPSSAEPHPEFCRGVDRSRDLWESALLTAAFKANKPVLGICRGFQVMNVVFGGTLWADLSLRPGAMAHQQALPRARASHVVQLIDGTQLAEIMEFSEFMVNSGHHQGIKELAPSLVASAQSEDGLIEALEHPEAKFLIGVQWHPEGQLAEAHSRILFTNFIMAAENT